MGFNSRQVDLNKEDLTSLYVDLNEKMKSGQIYNVKKVGANSVSPSNVQCMALTSTQLPTSIIGVFNGVIMPTNGSIVMATMIGSVGTPETTVLYDDFKNILNMVELTDPNTNEAIQLTDSHATHPRRQVFGLLQTVAVNGAAVSAGGNCQISFVVLDSTNNVVLVNLSQTVEFNTNKFYDGLHLPKLISASDTSYKDETSVGNMEYVERTFRWTSPSATGDQLNINSGLLTGTGVVALSTVVDGVSVVVNLNITGSATIFTQSPAIEVHDGGIKMHKGISPLTFPTEVAWISTNTISFYRPMDIGDVVKIRIPLKNN